MAEAKAKAEAALKAAAEAKGKAEKAAAEKAAADKAAVEKDRKEAEEEPLVRKKADEKASKLQCWGELMVTIQSARHLPKMDVIGTCDSFCVVEWQGQKFQTTVKKNSYSPDWNETFAFPVKNI